MNIVELSSAARSLIDTLKQFHRKEHPLPVDELDLDVLEQELRQQNLITSGDTYGYVIRRKKSGDIVLLNRTNDEIIIASREFAAACLYVLKEQSRDFSLLEILE